MSRPSVDSPEDIRRGSVWWVAFDPTRGSEIRKTRPAVVLSADALNRVRRTVVVVPLSTGPAPRPPIVVAVSSAGAGSAAVCDQIRAVDRSRFTRSGKTCPGTTCAPSRTAFVPCCGCDAPIRQRGLGLKFDEKSVAAFKA